MHDIGSGWVDSNPGTVLRCFDTCAPVRRRKTGGWSEAWEKKVHSTRPLMGEERSVIKKGAAAAREALKSQSLCRAGCR